MAKALAVSSVIVMVLLVVAANAAGPAPTGAEVLREHVKKANAHLSSVMRQAASSGGGHATTAARIFGAQQTTEQIQCISTCTQTCVTTTSNCGADCGTACANGCVTQCIPNAVLNTPAPAGGGSTGGGSPATPATPAPIPPAGQVTTAQLQCISTCTQTCVTTTSNCGTDCGTACANGCTAQCIPNAVLSTPAATGGSTGGSGSGASGGGGAIGGGTPSPPTRCSAVAETSATVQNLKRLCGGFEFNSVFDFSNHSAAAHVEVNAFCSPSCSVPYNAFIRDYRECFPSETLEYVNVLTSLCTSDSGEYCAWRLRAVDQLTACDDFVSGLSQSSCEANTLRNRYCKWNAAERTCNVKPEVALLQQACTPCYDKWVFLIARMTSITAGSSASAQETVRLAQALVAIQKNFYCSKSNDVWCNPLVESLDKRVPSIEPSNNVSLDVIRANVSNICTADGKVCVNKHAGAQVDLIREVTEATYRSCMRSAGNIVTREALCIDAYRTVFQAVAQLNQDLSFMCRRNERDEACLPLAHEFVRSPCIATLTGRDPLCDSTCATWVQNQTVTLGCCWDRYGELSFESQYPNTAVLPTPVAAAFVRAPAGGRNYTHNPGRPYVEACANTTGFNAAAARAQVAARCPTVAAVRKELRLVGVRWSRIESNATLKRAMEEALRSDMARSLGVAASAIVNGTLVADSSQSLTGGESAPESVSASASGSAGPRRAQQEAATSGTSYEFDLQLDSAAETTAAATRYETAKSSGQLQVTSTATVVSSQCTDCVGSPTAAPGQTAAPPPTGDLFASIAGSSTNDGVVPASPQAATPSPPSPQSPQSEQSGGGRSWMVNASPGVAATAAFLASAGSLAFALAMF